MPLHSLATDHNSPTSLSVKTAIFSLLASLMMLATRRMVMLFHVASLVLSAFLITSCDGQPTEGSIDDHSPPILYIYNWTGYMPQQIIDRFERQTGIHVIYETYGSNDELYDRITGSHSHSYDLIIPSNYYVDRMRDEGLLQPINKSKLSNFSQLNSILLDNNTDPDNQYSVPYLWGMTGIAVDSEAINPNHINSWNDLWREEFRGRVMLTTDMREVFGMTLLSLGYSSNSENPEEIKEAYEKLMDLLPSVAVIQPEADRYPYLKDRADIGMIWNGEAFAANNVDMPGLRFITPREGSLLWIDSFAIPKDAPNPDAAHKFINFVLRAENSQIISREFGYATPNMGARLFMPVSTKSSNLIYPSDETLKHTELQTQVSPEAFKLYQYYWRKLNTIHHLNLNKSQHRH